MDHNADGTLELNHESRSSFSSNGGSASFSSDECSDHFSSGDRSTISTDYASPVYRSDTLYSALISVGIQWQSLPHHILEVVKHLRDFSSTLPKNCDIADQYLPFRRANSPEAPLPKLILERAQLLVTASVAAANQSEAHWVPIGYSALKSLLECPDFFDIRDTLFTAPNPFIATGKLTTPKPDVAIAFRSSDAVDVDYGPTAPPFSFAYLHMLKQRPDVYLHPEVNLNESEAIYPFFACEIKSSMRPLIAAINQLCGTLAALLGKLRDLRQTAAPEDATHALFVFGAATSGANWELYVAYERDPAADDLRTDVVRFWKGSIDEVEDGVELLWILDKIQGWALGSLKPLLERWLESLRVPRIPPVSHEI